MYWKRTKFVTCTSLYENDYPKCLALSFDENKNLFVKFNVIKSWDGVKEEKIDD